LPAARACSGCSIAYRAAVALLGLTAALYLTFVDVLYEKQGMIQRCLFNSRLFGMLLMALMVLWCRCIVAIWYRASAAMAVSLVGEQ